MTLVVQIRQKGVVTLPVKLRRQYGLSEGDVLTLLDLGEGAFMFTTGVSQVGRLADQVAEAMAEAGVTLDEILDTLDQGRERYYQEHYVESGHPVSG